MWATDDMVHLTDRIPASAAGTAWQAETATINLFSAANETVSFQLIIDAPESGVEQATVAVGPLVDEDRQIPAANIHLFRMQSVAIEHYPAWYLRLTEDAVQPARFYDALVPMGQSRRRPAFDLAAGGRLAVWVDVRVPRQALPGEYVGPITVRYRRGVARGSANATVRVRVHDFVLPDARPILCAGGFSHETIFRTASPGGETPAVPARLDASRPQVRQALVTIRKLMRTAHAHRVDLFDKTLHPLLKRDTFGAVALHWEEYDNIVKPYLDGTAFDDRVGVSIWPAPLRLEPAKPRAWARAEPGGWPMPADYGGVDSAGYRDTAAAVISQTARHFESLGMSAKLFLWPRADESAGSGYELHSAIARLARSAEPNVPILTTLSPAPPPEAKLPVPENFAALADMFAPPADMFAPGQVARAAAKRPPPAGLWLRPDRPPYLGSCGVLALPADVRALPWIAMKYGAVGIFLPEVLNWTTDADAGGSASRLFYRGDNGEVLPSVRLKRLRRGLQDAAYCWLLRQRQRPAVARALIDTMVHYAALDAAGDHYLDPRLDGWVRQGSLWIQARKVLAEEVLAAVHPEDVSNRRLLALAIARKQLAGNASRVRVEQIRSRFEPTAGGMFRVSIQVELYNELVRPVEATLRTEMLRPGWRSVQGSQSLLLEGGQRRTVELTAEGDHVPTRFDGRMEIPLALTSELRERRELAALVPFLLVGWADNRITVDGDLRDWPLRPGNTAADFKLLGRRGSAGDGLAKRQTAVFAVHDEKTLYLAFRCDEPQPDRIHALPSNILRHEQLMACGEDLVEVIFDPGRSGRSAADLYHLAVKCNGVVLAERGVNTDPPLGQAGPWPVSAQAAVKKREKLWIVELALPLNAFGPGKPPRLWGVNFARFATAQAESSSWAGAARYFYDPRNLGTMYLVPKGGQPPRATTQPAP